MTKVTNIAKNTSYFTLALVLQKVISFSYFIILARNLGPESLGKYYFAISFATIFAIAIDFGMSNVLIREFGKFSTSGNNENNESQKLVSGVMGAKLVLAVLASVAAISVINLLDYPDITRRLVYLSLICVNLDSFTASFFAIIRGFHNLFFESISSVIFQLIVLTTGITLLKLGYGLAWVMMALVMASFFNFIYSSLLVTKKWKVNLRPRWDVDVIRQILIFTAPFGIFALLQRAYFYFDTVLLSKLAGDYYVGIYQIPFKMIFALQFLPMAFIASLYPAMSSYWMNNKEQLRISFERALNYLIIISLPISVGIVSLADKIIILFKEGYDDAILPIQITMLALLFVFINFPIGSLLNACDQQRRNTLNMGITFAASVILNLILIPKYQAIGASITVLVTNFLMFILGIYYANKIIEIRAKKIIGIFMKVFISVVLMSLVIFYLKSSLNIFIVIPIGAVIYFLVLFLLKGFRKEDIASILNSFSKKSKAI